MELLIDEDSTAESNMQYIQMNSQRRPRTNLEELYSSNLNVEWYYFLFIVFVQDLKEFCSYLPLLILY